MLENSNVGYRNVFPFQRRQPTFNLHGNVESLEASLDTRRTSLVCLAMDYGGTGREAGLDDCQVRERLLVLAALALLLLRMSLHEPRAPGFSI